MWFMVCCWPQSQEGDWVRPHLCKLAQHGPWPVQKQPTKDHTQVREIETWPSDSRVGNNGVADHRSRRPVLSPLRNCVDRCHAWPYWKRMPKDTSTHRPTWMGPVSYIKTARKKTNKPSSTFDEMTATSDPGYGGGRGRSARSSSIHSKPPFHSSSFCICIQ